VRFDLKTPRLRLCVAQQSAVDVDALRTLGTRGLVRPSAEVLQVVVGTIANQLAGERSGKRLPGRRQPPPTTSAAPAMLDDTTAPAHGSRRPETAWSGERACSPRSAAVPT